jgi:hypothetical protein
LTNEGLLGELEGMDIRVIVFGMCFVLASLFIVANFYIPKAKKKSLKEADYSIAAQEFLKNPSQDRYQDCVTTAKAFLEATRSNQTVEDFLKKENITFLKA